MFRKNLLLTATVLAGLSGPALAETIPCTDVAKYGIDAEVVGKTFASIWQGSTIPERHAIKIMDVIPPIVSNSNPFDPTVCVIHMVTTEGDLAYGFRIEVVNGKSYLFTVTSKPPYFQRTWADFLDHMETMEKARQAAETSPCYQPLPNTLNKMAREAFAQFCDSYEVVRRQWGE